MSPDPTPIEITLRGIAPMDEMVSFVRSRAARASSRLGAPPAWHVLVEAVPWRGGPAYRCRVQLLEGGRRIEADCSGRDLFALVEDTFEAVRRTWADRAGQPRGTAHLRVRPGRRADESTGQFAL